MLREVKRKQTWEQKWRSCSDVESVMVYSCSSISNLFLLLCIFVCFSGFSFLCAFVSPSPMGSCTSFVLLQILYAKKKMKPRPTGSHHWFMVSLLFSLFPLLSLLLSIFLTSQWHKRMKETFSILCVFLPYCLPLYHIFSLVFLFSRFSRPFFLFCPALFSMFFLLPMLFFSLHVRSLEGLIYSLNISLFRKDSMH